MSGEKRWRTPKAKPGQLIARYGREVGGQSLQILYAWGGEGACKSDSRIVMRALEDLPLLGGKTLVEELIARGYDITTLRFSVERPRPTAPATEQEEG